MAETAVATHLPPAGEMATKRPYLAVFGTLAVVTGIELAITQPGLLPEIEHTLRIVVLVILSTVKASLVVAYYMHLRYEPRWLALIPLAGLALVAVLVAALTATVAHP
jgi:cytochrome c oxidase subunit IV